MNSMSIPLTCPCGQQQFVAPELAGQTSPCVSCGKSLSVPAMGVLQPTRPRAKVRSTQVRSAPIGLILLGAVGLLVFGTGGAWLAWELSSRPSGEPVAQHKTPDEKPPIAPPERQRPEPEKKNPPLLEPVKPVDPPKTVLEPVKPKDAPKQIVEPIKVKPKDPIVAKKPANVMEPLKLVWKLREGEAFFQELIVTQKPTFKIGNVPIASLLNYRIVSRFSVKTQNDDGSLVVEQKIENAKLLQADDLSKSTVEGAIAKLPGTSYTLHLSPKMDVTKFEGGATGLNIVGLGAGFQMASLIDRDGWKELAQATFFQLDQTPKANLRWSKPMSHNWGGLGVWNGQIHYAYLGPQANLHRVSYSLQLTYKSPAAGGIGLMTINSANFLPPEAGGALLFDAVKGRVISAEERFRVKGVISANVLGQNSRIEIDEDQHFLIRIHDKIPQK